MSEPFKVSNSKVKTWRRCRYAYHLKYVERIERKSVSRPLQFGRLIHSCIEAYANGDDPQWPLDNISLDELKLFKSERQEYGDLLGDLRVIVHEYFQYHKDDLFYIKVNGKRAEHEFDVPLTNSINVTGKIDAFVRTGNKLKWLMEHKSFNRMPSEDDRWRNTQTPLYTRIVEMHGWLKLDGVCWDYIWSKAPTWPQVLKNGLMSTKPIDTLPERVAQAYRMNQLEAPAGVLSRAADNRRKWFVRTYAPVKKAVVDHVWTDFVATSREMADLHGKCRDRNIDRHCSWCDFEPICRAELNGHNSDFIRRNDYRAKPAKSPADYIDPEAS